MPRSPSNYTPTTGSSIRPHPLTIIPPPKPGDIVPRIEINFRGNPVNLGEYFQKKRGLIFGILDVNNPTCRDTYLLPFRDLHESIKNQVDFIGCVVPNEPEVVRKCARDAQITEQIIFISDVRKRFFSKFGALVLDGAAVTCRRFVMAIDVKSTFKLVVMDEFRSKEMMMLRECLEEFPTKKEIVTSPNQIYSKKRVSTLVVPILLSPTSTVSNSSPIHRSTFPFVKRPKAAELYTMSKGEDPLSDIRSIDPDRSLAVVQDEQGTQQTESKSKTLNDDKDSHRLTSDSSIEITPRTQSLIDRRRTTAETSKWIAALLTSSTRHACLTNGPHDLISAGFSYRDVCFEYGTKCHVDALISASTSSIEVIPNEPGNFGTVYHRGGSYHAVNFNLHTPAEHLFKDDSGGIRPLELFIVHELIGGRGEKTPLVYCVTFDVESSDGSHFSLPNQTLTSLLRVCDCQRKSRSSGLNKFIRNAQFELNSLIVPEEEKLVRYVGNVKLFAQSVTWIVRQSPLIVPLEQLTAVLELIGKPQIAKSLPSNRSSPTMRNAHGATLEELYCLSFAPFKRNPEEDEGRDAFEIVLDQLFFVGESGNVAFKLFSEALMFCSRDDEVHSDVLLLLLDSFTERLQVELTHLSNTIADAISGRSNIEEALRGLEESSLKCLKCFLHPIRRSFFGSFLDLDAESWLSPALLKQRTSSHSSFPISSAQQTEFRMTSNFTNVKQQSQLSKTQVETLAKQAGLRRGNSEFEEGYYFEKTTQQSARKDHGALVDGKAASVPEGMAESEEGEEHIYNEIESNHIEDFGLEKTNLFSSEGDSDVKTKMVEFMNTCLPDVSVSSSFDDQTKANTAINKAANTAINKAVSTAESVADTDTSSEDRRVVKPTHAPPAKGTRTLTRRSSFKGVPTKGAVFQKQTNVPKATIQKQVKISADVDEDSDCRSWNEVMRTKHRIDRLNQRKPTGHQTRGCKLKQLQPEPSNSDNSSDGRCVVRLQLGRSTEKTDDRKGVRYRARFASEDGELTDDDWKRRHHKRTDKIEARHPRVHPRVSALKKEFIKLKSEDEDDFKDFADFTEDERKNKGKTKASFKVPLTQVVDVGESGWDNDKRKKSKLAKLTARRPTGLPCISKRLGLLLNDHDSVVETTTPLFKVKRGLSISSRGSTIPSSGRLRVKRSKKRAMSGAPIMVNKCSYFGNRIDETPDSNSDGSGLESPPKTKSKNKRSTKSSFTTRTATIAPSPEIILDSAGDSNWEETNRHLSRISRIARRKPTGHPGIAQRINTVLRDLQLNNDEGGEIAKPMMKLEKLVTKPKKVVSLAPVLVKTLSGTEAWSDSNRATNRIERIKRRRPTGYSAVRKMFPKLLKEFGSDEKANDIAVKSSKRIHVSSSEEFNEKSEGDSGSKSWDDRQGPRFARVCSGKATAQPTLGKKTKFSNEYESDEYEVKDRDESDELLQQKSILRISEHAPHSVIRKVETTGFTVVKSSGQNSAGFAVFPKERKNEMKPKRASCKIESSDSESNWGEEHRKRSRHKRISRRRPTGYPILGKFLDLEMQR